MKTSYLGNTKFSFEIKDTTVVFENDMHDFAIMCDPETGKHIHFPDAELAQQESDRLNALGIEGLITRHLGFNWRIMLVTWQDKSVLGE